MLHLRLLSLFGGTCSTAFYASRGPPVWGAVFWGMVFGLVNLTMLMRLYMERMNILQISKEDVEVCRVVNGQFPLVDRLARSQLLHGEGLDKVFWCFHYWSRENDYTSGIFQLEK